MNGKEINPTPTNLSYGGVFTKEAASPITSLQSNVGAAALNVTKHTSPITVASGSYKSGTATINVAKSGYTALGIVSVDTGRYDFAFRRYLISGNEARVTVYCDKQNVASNQTSTISVWVLYIKD